MSKIGKIVKKSNSLFYWTCWYLFPKAKREAIYAVYAFCRHIEAIATGDMPAEERVSLMQAWNEEIHNIYDNKVPATEVGRYIYKNCMRFKLPKEGFVNLLHEFALNVPNPIQTLSEKDFYEYCQTVSGVPCYFAMKIMGIDDTTANKLAKRLGMFFQITDILLNVKDDAKMNRLYVPIEFLLEKNINISDPEHIIANKNFSFVRETLADIAEENLSQVKYILSDLDKKSALPFYILLNIYEQYFYSMKARGWEVMSPKPYLSPSKELSLILRTIMH